MEIRKTMPTDNFNAIASIYAFSWKSAYKGIVHQEYQDKLSETRWSEKLPDSPWDSFVLIKDGVYIGTSSIGSARDEAMDGWGEIISMYLLPEYFGKCYGKPLLDRVISELVIMGYRQIYLWVLEDNIRARAFYEKNGFDPTSDKMAIEIGGEELIEMRYIYCI